MASVDSYPPIYHHPTLSKPLSPSQAETQLSAFLKKSESKPYLHPDAQLSITGISWSAESGPSGGLSLHHLRRIAAGLRGENLVAESADELAQFGKPVSDDTKVDALIAESNALKSSKRRRSEAEISQWAEDAAVGEWQTKEEFEQQQEALEGEVGDREGARMVKEGGGPPRIKKVKGDDKAAKKAAKKERHKAEKAERLAERKAAAEG